MYIFSIIAIFLIVIAAINFMNLATASSARRAVEVGIRKVVGANKKRLVWQFLSESLIITLVSLFLAGTLLGTQTSGVFSPLRITSTLVVLSAVLASTDNRRHLIAFGVLVLGWMVATWSPVEGTVLIEDAFLTLVLFYLVVLMGARLVRRDKVKVDDINGAIAVYLCLALAWAASYRFLDGLNPEAFSISC